MITTCWVERRWHWVRKKEVYPSCTDLVFHSFFYNLGIEQDSTEKKRCSGVLGRTSGQGSRQRQRRGVARAFFSLKHLPIQPLAYEIYIENPFPFSILFYFIFFSTILSKNAGIIKEEEGRQGPKKTTGGGGQGVVFLQSPLVFCHDGKLTLLFFIKKKGGG